MLNIHPPITTNDFIASAGQNLTEKSLSFANLPGGSTFGTNPLGFITGSHVAGYNGIVRASFPANEADEHIQAAVDFFQARGVPFTWWTGPATQPANLGARLQMHGFIHNRDMIGMCADIQQLKSGADDLPRLAIEPVSTPEMLAEWLPIYAQGFGTPLVIAKESLESLGKLAFRPDSCWKHFTVRAEGQIIAISSLFIYAETAGLYNLVTNPDARRKGIGAAMTLGTFNIARDLGCRIATLQTTYPNAMRLYHRLRFEVYCKFGIYPYLKSASPA